MKLLVLSLSLAAVSGALAVTAIDPHNLPLANPALRYKVDLAYGAAQGALEPEITSGEAELIRGLVDRVQSDPRGALQVLKASLTPQSSGMMDFIVGNLHFQLEEKAEALRYYQSAIRKFPRFAKAHKNLGFLALQSENLDAALNSFVKTVELGSREGAVFGLIGYIYLNRENYLPAESAYRQAMMKMPETIDWKLGIGRAVLALDRQEDVVSVMGELITRDPRKGDYWLVQSNAFIAMNQPMLAAYNYEIMARLGLGNRDTFAALGNIYLSQELSALALNSFLKAIALPQPPTIETVLAGAEILGARGAVVQADELAARIAEVYGKSATKEQNIRLLKLRSQLALARDLQDVAERFLEQLIKLDDSDGQTIQLLADFYARSGRYEQAAPLYTRAEKIPGFEVSTLIKHAQVLVNAGDYEKAIELLERSQQIEARENVARYLEQVRRVYRNSRF